MRPRRRRPPDNPSVEQSIEANVSNALRDGYDSVACYQGGSHWHTIEISPHGLDVQDGYSPEDDPDLDRALKQGFRQGIDAIACRNRPEPLDIRIAPTDGREAVPDTAVALVDTDGGGEARESIPESADLEEAVKTAGQPKGHRQGKQSAAAATAKSKSGKEPRAARSNKKGKAPSEIRRFARQARR